MRLRSKCVFGKIILESIESIIVMASLKYHPSQISHPGFQIVYSFSQVAFQTQKFIFRTEPKSSNPDA